MVISVSWPQAAAQSRGKRALSSQGLLVAFWLQGGLGECQDRLPGQHVWGLHGVRLKKDVWMICRRKVDV